MERAFLDQLFLGEAFVMKAPIYRTSLGRVEELLMRQLFVGQLHLERFPRRILLMIMRIVKKELMLLLERSLCQVSLVDNRDCKERAWYGGKYLLKLM